MRNLSTQLHTILCAFLHHPTFTPCHMHLYNLRLWPRGPFYSSSKLCVCSLFFSTWTSLGLFSEFDSRYRPKHRNTFLTDHRSLQLGFTPSGRTCKTQAITRKNTTPLVGNLKLMWDSEVAATNPFHFFPGWLSLVHRPPPMGACVSLLFRFPFFIPFLLPCPLALSTLPHPRQHPRRHPASVPCGKMIGF